MREIRARHGSLRVLAGFLALFVALGAVLVCEPLDAWTTSSASDSNPAPATGERALPQPSDVRRDRAGRRHRRVMPPRPRRVRRRFASLQRRSTHRPRALSTVSTPRDWWSRSRAAPAPDRAPPRLMAA
jgi:hypothetical protein